MDSKKTSVIGHCVTCHLSKEGSMVKKGQRVRVFRCYDCQRTHTHDHHLRNPRRK